MGDQKAPRNGLYAGERTLRLGCPILPVMILLTPHRRATDTFCNEYLSFRFRLVRMWELPAAAFLVPGAPQLWPWASVAKDGVASVPKFDTLLRKAKGPRERIAAFFGVLLGLRDREASADFFQQHRRIMIESPAYEYIKREGSADVLVALLEDRFGAIPSALLKKLSRLQDAKLITKLALLASRSHNLREFQAALP